MALSAARLGLSMLAVLAIAACAAPAPAPTPPPAVAAPALVSPDQDFVNRAATGTAAQAELGRLARTRALSAPVRTYGSHISAEHARIYADLTREARRAGISPSLGLSGVSRMAALSGPDFDRQFMADQVNNQREALALFEAEAQNGQDPRLRRFASQWIPELRRDLQRAQALAAGIGVY